MEQLNGGSMRLIAGRLEGTLRSDLGGSGSGRSATCTNTGTTFGGNTSRSGPRQAHRHFVISGKDAVRLRRHNKSEEGIVESSPDTISQGLK